MTDHLFFHLPEKQALERHAEVFLVGSILEAELQQIRKERVCREEIRNLTAASLTSGL